MEHIFLLMYYQGFSYQDAYRLPVWQRIWFIERINKEIEKMQTTTVDQLKKVEQEIAYLNSKESS